MQRNQRSIGVRVAAVSVPAAAALCLVGCGDNLTVEYRAGGDTTVEDRTSNAYGFPASNIEGGDLRLHLDGDLAFEATFVTGGAPVNNGLGPLYNNSSCRRCHGRDGRGLPLIGAGASSQSLVRVSLPDGEPEVPGGSVPVPGMGTQVQNHAVFGQEPEARIALGWAEREREYGDGTPYSLREPRLSFERPDGTPIEIGAAAGLLTSLRQPPAVFGLGLLEAIEVATLERWADPDDADGDGISGRINRVWDPKRGVIAVGRFGHKANMPDLLLQAGSAYFNDMGITNAIFGSEDGSEDLPLETVEAAAFYTRTLAVPAAIERDAEAERGQELFAAFGCASCHIPEVETGDHVIAALANQAIQPYTDLLLHDMGEGLADGRPDFLAGEREWRTPPLWGLGLVQTVQPGSGYLHDGRARDIAEAILWHGGEAESSRDEFRDATADDRAALLAFLRSL